MRQVILTLCVMSGGAALPYVASAQVCGECEVSASKRAQHDQALDLTDAQRQQAVGTHLLWGVPTGPGDASGEHLLVNTDYVINYDDDLRIPVWAGYRLTRDDIVSRTRKNCFRHDPRLSDEASSHCDDHRDSEAAPADYDRGHLVPRADMNRSEEAMINTFALSNMTPQHDKFNRRVWKRLECLGRQWARAKGEIHIYTGCILDRDEQPGRDSDDDALRMPSNDGNQRVAVPSAFYKIFIHVRPSTYVETMTFILPHEDDSPPQGRDTLEYLDRCLNTINEVELRTGIDFLPGMGTAVKKSAIKAFQATGFWQLAESDLNRCAND